MSSSGKPLQASRNKETPVLSFRSILFAYGFVMSLIDAVEPGDDVPDADMMLASSDTRGLKAELELSEIGELLFKFELREELSRSE